LRNGELWLVAWLWYRGAEVSASTQEFAEYYRGLADEELLNLALQKHELLEAAASALEREMASRNLGEAALHVFREGRRLEAEEEPEVGPQEASSEPRVATELPSDWFDDDDESTAAYYDHPTRPKAATVLSLLFWLGGAIGISLGVLQVSGGVAEFRSSPGCKRHSGRDFRSLRVRCGLGIVAIEALGKNLCLAAVLA